MGLAGIGGAQNRDDARGGLSGAAITHDWDKVAIRRRFLKRSGA
jgi:hypothetical protein